MEAVGAAGALNGPAARSDPRREQLRRTLRAAASLLEVARVSVWAYGETGEHLHRLAQHDREAGRGREPPRRLGA